MGEGDEGAKPARFEVKGKKLNVINVSLEDIKRHSTVHVSPRTGKLGAGIRSNCLCSPTSHRGSFRCRQHRVAVSGMSSASSAASNLYFLGQKHNPPQPIADSLITDNLQPQSSF